MLYIVLGITRHLFSLKVILQNAPIQHDNKSHNGQQMEVSSKGEIFISMDLGYARKCLN